MQHVTQLTFFDAAESLNNPYLICFFSNNSDACSRVVPLMDQVSIEWAGKIDILSVEINESPKLSKMFKVSDVPTLISVVDACEVTRFQGIYSAQQVNNFVNTVIKDFNV